MRSSLRLVGFAIAAILLFSPRPARADITWTLAGTGDWSVSTNWSGSAVPNSSNHADIYNGGTTTITKAGEDCSVLALGGTGGGTVQMTGGGLGTTVTYVGESGTGNFTQSGGTNSSDYLYVGYSLGSNGTYNLGGTAQLSVQSDEYVGFWGTAAFTQSGGTNQGNLLIGYGPGSTGVYSLSGTGQLSTSGGISVGGSGAGTFAQSGGTVSLSWNQSSGSYGTLYVGGGTGGGTYSLSGGALLSAPQTWEYIGGDGGAALFQQSGGSNAAGCISIGTGGRYLLTGGTLQINYALTNAGVFDGGNGAGTLVANCLVDLTSGTWQNLGAMSVSLGANSLLIVPAGFNPSKNFGSYNSLGITHTAGSTLVVPAGQGFGGEGSISDSVSCQGTITAEKGPINLNNGLVLSGNGLISLHGGNVTVNDAVSGIWGGSLTGSNQYVGYSGTGTFTQPGGASDLNSLFLGYNAADSGAYSLSGSGGLFCDNEEVVGYSGTGTFTQSGGTNAATGALVLGSNKGSTGTYSLSGSSTLNCQSITEDVGGSGTGTLTQSGGTNTAVRVNLGAFGTYDLNGGALIIELVSGSTGAAFNFGGGTLQASGPFSTALPMTLTGSGGNATVNTAGNTVTLSGSLFGPGGLTKTDIGTLVLSAVNTYAGPTAVNGGILSVTGSLSGSTSLTVGGGTFSYAPTANGGAGNSQSVAGLTVNTGLSAVNASAANTLALGTMARNTAGVVDFNGGTTGTITTTQPNTNGILGPWAVYGSGTSLAYAAASGSGAPYTIVPYTGATPVASGVIGLTDTTGTVNYAVSSGGGTLGAAVTANTIQFTGAANTLTASAASPLSLNGIMNDGSGTATITGGNFVIGSTKELVFTGPGNVTVASVIQDNASGASALTMAGSGTLVLAAANTYSGSTTVSAGTLQLGNNAAVGGASALSIGSGAVLDLNGFSPTFGILTGGGAVANTHAGASTLTLAPLSGTTNTFSGVIQSGTGTINLTLNTASIEILSGVNTYTGTTTIDSGGTLQIGDGSTGGIGSTSSVVDNGLVEFDLSGAPTVTAVISGSGGLAQLGSGPLFITGSNTYTGRTTIAGGGTVVLGAGGGTTGSIGGTSGVIDNGVLEFAFSVASTFSSAISGNGALQQDSYGLVILTGGNSYTGPTTIGDGTLQLNNAQAAQNSTVTVDVNNGLAFGPGVTAPILGGLAGAGNVTLATTNSSAVALTVGGNNSSTTYTGTLSGSGSLTKAGTGALVLTGSNTYTGGTTVEAGILVAANGANGSATGSGSVALSGGTLASGDGEGSISGEVEIGPLPSEIAPGGIGSTGTLTIGSLLTASNLTTLDFDLTTPDGSGDLLVVTGDLTLAPNTAIAFGSDPTTSGDYPLIGYGSLRGSLSYFDLPAAPPYFTYTLSTTVDPGYIDLVVVPEPSTFVLLGVAAAGLLAYAWRRTRAA
jgi:autotransporter-associated beta strand protein